MPNPCEHRPDSGGGGIAQASSTTGRRSPHRHPIPTRNREHRGQQPLQGYERHEEKSAAPEKYTMRGIGGCGSSDCGTSASSSESAMIVPRTRRERLGAEAAESRPAAFRSRK